MSDTLPRRSARISAKRSSTSPSPPLGTLPFKPSKNNASASSRKKPSTANQPAPTRTPCPVPDTYPIIYPLLKEYRLHNAAPVDTIGCASLAHPSSPPIDRRFQTLVALILSAASTDHGVAKGMSNLYRWDGGLTVDNVLRMGEERLLKEIEVVGIGNKKSAYIMNDARVCKEQYGGDIPDTVEGLKALQGVRKKVAYLCMQFAWDKNVGIGVDTHVHRITNRLGWVSTKTADETGLALEDWLPQSEWKSINPVFVGLGQTLCTASAPFCNECPAKDLCPKKGVKEIHAGKSKVQDPHWMDEGVLTKAVKEGMVTVEKVWENRDWKEKTVKQETVLEESDGKKKTVKWEELREVTDGKEVKAEYHCAVEQIKTEEWVKKEEDVKVHILKREDEGEVTGEVVQHFKRRRTRK
ncbi:DNA N-glycosylase and apurinic/apyrimidinic (AP) lyase [Borealophlyctis nickersoniae]|nr:DNA N-glycosylase and apurinic/apyrimidinic (AP) lyase [Borealophlyctis nickersoniae]